MAEFPPRAKPVLRGHLHLAAALASPFALYHLLYLANSPAEYAGSALFGGGMIVLFSVSAGYHVPHWPERARRVLRRVDHASVFAFVALAYAPFCIVALPPAWGLPLLCVVSLSALLGVVLKLTRPDLPAYVSLASYVILGWAAVAALPAIVSALSPLAITMILGSGLFYTSGAVTYTMKRPDPFPRVFGHHELFHLATIVATALLYLAVVTDVLE